MIANAQKDIFPDIAFSNVSIEPHARPNLQTGNVSQMYVASTTWQSGHLIAGFQ